MKKYLFQIFAICILSFSFTTLQAQCDHCYDEAVGNYNDLMPFDEGECGSEALAQLKTAKLKFDQAKQSGSKSQIDYAGYVLMHNLINYMSMLNSCNGECGDDACKDSVAKSNSMSDCLKQCGSPYADALCKTAAYIECQCDCTCDEWWKAECKEDECDDCTLTFVPDEDMDLTGQFQLTRSAYFRFCDPQFGVRGCTDLAFVYQNETNCDLQDVYEKTIEFDPLGFQLVDELTYEECVSDVLHTVPGCESASVDLFLNSQGLITYEVSYDCETCPLFSIEANVRAYNVSDCNPALQFDKNTRKRNDCGVCN